MSSWIRHQWDRATAIVATTVGASMITVGWARVSGTGLAAEQLPYVVSCGIGGLFALGIGAVLWLSADLRDEWRKLDDMQRTFEAAHAAPAPSPDSVGFPAVPEIPEVRSGSSGRAHAR